jgi:hypothetical protein
VKEDLVEDLVELEEFNVLVSVKSLEIVDEMVELELVMSEAKLAVLKGVDVEADVSA